MGARRPLAGAPLEWGDTACTPENWSIGLSTIWAPESENLVKELIEFPKGREFSGEFLGIWDRAVLWIASYRDGYHLARAAYWVMKLQPEASEEVILGTLTHDIERSVAGGPILDKQHTAWDDPTYNRAHCERSAAIVKEWLKGQGARDDLISGVEQPILEHEFGGSPEGDLAQAGDSLSFLETCVPRVVEWISSGEIDENRAQEKVDFMFYRVRLPAGRERARPFYERFCEQLKAIATGDSGGRGK